MSTTIDERVVEMRFDNDRFEKNVATSMGTLAKLKQSLNLTGAAKGLENINAAARSNNISALGTAADTVGLKFNAMYTIADQVLRNITTRVQHTAESMVKALTLDPIISGFQEYETQINAVQTILANTESKGSTIEDVNKALDELNTYADKTIYNFTEMTRNIGTFTAAGIDLETSVNAIQGIANLAAVSGSTSQQASTAMYQLSQALASGTVKLMDWNSVVNAGMGGEVFQNALKETARVHGIAIDDMIESEGSFRETLSKGWLTSDILTETLEKFTMATEDLTEAEIEANREKLRSIGYTEEQIEEIFKLGNTATNAATKVKTFTQLWDVLKESAQSGWAKTWQLIIGDFEEAKSLLTPFADFLTNIINGISDARNNLLEAALDSPFAKIIDKINDVTKVTEKVIDTTAEYAAVVEKVIGGEYGDGEDRWRKLCDEGYNWAKVQNMVNEQLGSSVRHNEELWAVKEKTTKTQATTIAQLAKMEEGQLRSLGLNTEEIQSLKELQKAAEAAGYTVEEVVNNPSLLSGRQLLIDGFKNIGKAIMAVATVCKEAWQEIFPPQTLEQRAEKIYNLIAAFRKFTANMILTGDNAEYLKRTLKGVFAALDLILTAVGGPFKVVLKTVIQLLGKFDINLLEYTANIGDAIVKLRDWIDEHNIFVKGATAIINALKNIGNALRNWAQGLKGASPKEVAEAIVSGLGNVITYVAKVFSQLKTYIVEQAKNIGGYMATGLKNGIWDKIKFVGQVIRELANIVIEKFCEIMGIHSPSTVFYALGGFLVMGLLMGIKAFAPQVWEYIKNFGTTIVDSVKNSVVVDGLSSIGDKIKSFFGKVVEFIKGIDFGKLFAAGLAVGMLVAIIKIVKVFEMFASPLEGLRNVLDSIANIFDGISANFKAAAFGKRMNGVYSLAKAIAVLAVSIYLLSKIETPKLWATIGAIAALAAVMAGLAALAAWMSKNKDGIIDFQFSNIAVGILGIAAGILLMAIALKKMSSIDSKDIPKTLGIFAGIIVGLSVFMAAFGKFVKGEAAQNMDKAGKMLLKMSIAMLIMVGVIKLASKLEGGEIVKGIAVIALVSVLFAAIVAVSEFAGKNASKAGTMLLKMSIAMLIMIGVIKLASMLQQNEINRGIKLVTAVGMLFAALIFVSKLAGNNGSKAGSMLLMASLSLLVIIQVIKQIAKLDSGDIVKGIGVITILGVLFTALIYVSKFAGENATKAGIMLLAMSGALIVLTGVLYLLSKMDAKGLYTALGAVAILELLFTGIIKATSNAKNMTGSLIVMTVAVALLAGAIITLSFIDEKSLAIAAGALTSVIGVFALLVLATSTIKDTTKIAGTLIGLVAVVAALALVVWGLSAIDSTNVIPNCIGLSVLLLAVSGVLLILNDMDASKALPGVFSLLAMAVPLVAFVGVLALMQGVENATTNATALAALATVLTLLLIPLTVIGVFVDFAAAGVIALLAMAVPLVAFVGVLYLMEGLENATANANLLIDMLTVMTGVLTVLAIVGPLALIGETAMVGLIALMGVVATFATAVGALVTYFPSLEEFLNKGLQLLSDVAYGIGKFAGDLIAGFADGVMEILPNLGTKLSEFMTNAQGFIDGAMNIDESVITGVGCLAKALLAITAAELVAGLASFIPWVPSMGELGTQLSNFMENAQGFIEGASLLDEGMLAGVQALAKTILILTATDILQGLASWRTGGSSLERFGGQLPGLGANIASFAANLGTFTEAQTAAVGFAADAIVKLAEAANNIPNEGGWAAAILGDNSIAMFGSELPQLGIDLASFVTNLGTFSEDQVTTVGCAADAIVKLAEAANNIPNEGGWAAKILGDNSIATFGGYLPALGTNLASFVTNLGTFTEAQVTTVGCAADAIVKLADAADKIPNEGGWIAKILGDNSLATFGSQLGSLGTNLSTFVSNLGTFDNNQVNTVNAAVKAINAFADLADTDLKKAKDNLSGFGDKIVDLASDIDSFVDDMPSSSSVTSCIDNMKKLLSAINDLAKADASTATTFTNALKGMASDAVDAFMKAFSNKEGDAKKAGTALANKAVDGAKDKKKDFETAGKDSAVKFVDGMGNKESAAKTAGKDLAKAGKDGARSYYDDFKSAGKYLVEGFAAGISANTYKATAKAKAMAKAAKEAAEEALGIESPSKVFFGIGAYTVAGFVNALTDGTSDVASASESMADSARSGFAAAILGVTEALNADMDMQPTIRPVLDLSGVESGVGALDGMFDSTRSIRTMANLNAINSSMSQNGQNGFGDVVDAINKLGKSLGNIGGDSYSINGVTYDDGSNISEAVKTITRAAKIARRT